MKQLGKITGIIANWFISTAFIMWGWNVLASHINYPIFGYWEVFAIRMGFSYFITIISGNFLKKRNEVEEND